MSALVDFARHELSLIAGDEPDEMQDAMNAHLIRMVETFADEGHSGFSAAYATRALQKLLRFEPLSPLTGDENEWIELNYAPEMMAQNKRCSHVFRRADGTAYDMEAVIFREPDGVCFTSKDSCRDITFPYTPVREYADRAPSKEHP